MTSHTIIKLSSIINFIDDKKIFSKGENSFESGHVVCFNYLSDVGILSGQVHASMKNKLYDVKIFFKGNDVDYATCTCPTGRTKCHHMVSLLLHGHKNISVTDVSCSWSKKGTKDSEDIQTIDEMYPNDFKAIKDNSGVDFAGICYNKLVTMEKNVGFTWLLSPEPKSNDFSDILKLDHFIHSEEFRVSHNYKLMLEMFKVSFDDIKRIASETVGQSENIKWCLYRKYRLTSSNFHKILQSIKRNRYPTSLFKTLLGTYCVEGVKSIEWGKTHEINAVQEFEKKYNMQVIKTGVWLHESGLLASSPDGLTFIDDNSMSCIEVKCPYKYRDEDLKDCLSKTKEYIINFDVASNNFILNPIHQYYDQIQAQMYMTKTTSTILIVWTPKSLVALKVFKDDAWSTNIDLLLNFYYNQFIPFILSNNST